MITLNIYREHHFLLLIFNCNISTVFDSLSIRYYSTGAVSGCSYCAVKKLEHTFSSSVSPCVLCVALNLCTYYEDCVRIMSQRRTGAVVPPYTPAKLCPFFRVAQQGSGFVLFCFCFGVCMGFVFFFYLNYLSFFFFFFFEIGNPFEERW